MTFQGIIFDLDGTLANTLADIAGSMNRVLTARRYPGHGTEDYKLLVGRGLENLVIQALPEYARQPAEISCCLAEMMDDYDRNCLVNTCLYDGIRELIHELVFRKIMLAVFSNKAEPLTLKIVSHLLGEVNFERVMGARPDFPKKPDPAGAVNISNQMGINPSDIIYMGDSDVDMITATKAGMYAVGVLWGFRTGEELRANGAKLLINNPMDLISVFR
ncbi:MAG TPA: HAD family hydrolase [Bacteroidales bacterium]|nr:HAD family hydrolase [Bacteroidales bacterium]